MKNIARGLAIFLFVSYLISLGYSASAQWGIAGFILAVVFCIPLTLYQMVTHALAGDFMESIMIIVWIGSAYGLLRWSNKKAI